VTQSAIQRRLVRLAAAMNRKATRLGTMGRVSASELAQVLIESEGRCFYCQADVPWGEGSFDHVIPYALGGMNTASNIVRSCFTCNRTKGTKTPAELMEYLQLSVTCSCGKVFKPRFADWKRGYGKVCSRACAGRLGGRA